MNLEGIRLQALAAERSLRGASGRVAPGTALLFVGRSLHADMRFLSRARWRFIGAKYELGYALSWLDLFTRRVRVSRIVREALMARTEQLGSPRLAGATLRPASLGVYQGGREPTVEIQISFAKIEGKETDFETFRGHIVQMAERLAYALAQKEIAVTFTDENGKLSAVGASPEGFPGPDEASFEKFIADEIERG